MPVNWGLGLQQGPNAGEAFANSFQQGQEQNRQNTARNAMAALVQDPNNQRALQALAQVDPQSAQQFQQQKLEMARQQMGQHYDSVLKGAQLIRQMKPHDDASWQQVLQTAHQAGIDISEVPQHFDPQYVQSVTGLADAFAPQAQHNPQLVPFAPGGGVAAFDPSTGGVKMLVQPNDGGHAAGAPAADMPQVHDQASYDAVPPGGQYITPDGHVRVKGGQAGAILACPF
jgi:hypothetical protein